MAFVSWGLPEFVSSPLVRDRVVNASLTGHGLKAEMDAASVGWFHPTSVTGLRVVSTDGQIDVRAKELRINQSWWHMVLFSDQLGHLEVVNPSVTLVLGSTDTSSNFSLGEVPLFSARLEDAEFNLRLLGIHEPIISVSGLNADLRIAQEGASYLVVDRGVAFDHRPLTPDMCAGLLQLIDPTLRDVVRVGGTFSLDIEWLRVPLNVSPAEQIQQTEFAGVLHLHEIAVQTKTPLLTRILRVASDLHGKDPSDVVRLVKDNQIHLRVHQGRLYHDCLEVGFADMSPDLKVYSSGSVGLDASIDLQITVPEVLVTGEEEKADRTAVVCFHVSGTLDEPIIERLPADENRYQRDERL
jgi:hypothetical protein